MKKIVRNLNAIIMLISIIVCLISGIVSNMISTNFGKVEVNDISIYTDAGTIRGYLLVPENATVNNKAPGIVVVHGATSSAETVDSWYVELARRGYVVVVPNMFGHGDSHVADESYAGNIVYESRGVYSSVEYISTLPFVDANKIGVVGHSQGAGAALKTMQYYTNLENDALAQGATTEEAHALNKIAACLSASYPLEVNIEGIETTDPFNGYNAHLGAILGKADDFNSWLLKDILTNDTGISWVKTQTGVEVSEVEEGKFYANEENGYTFAMWNPSTIHSQSVISPKITGYVIDFFDETLGSPVPIKSSNQIWVVKTVFNALGMLGFFAFIIPCMYYILKIPYFKTLERENTFVLPPLLGKAKRKYLRAIITGVLINTITFLPIVLVGMLTMESSVLPQSSTNGFVLWGVVCATVTLLSVKRGTGLKYRENSEYFGFKTTWKEFGKLLLLSLSVLFGAYMLLFGVRYLFGSDFRLWQYAIRPFGANKLTIALRYLPLFFVLQFANGIAIRRNNFDNWSDNKRIAFSTSMSLIPVAILLIVTYLPILFTGSPLWAVDGSNLILLAAGQSANKLVSFVFSLGVTAFIHVKSQKFTGNIWAGALISSMLLTMISVSNTSFITMF